MKIGFDKHSPVEAVTALEKNLSGRKLGSMVSFELSKNELVVIISKLGKSKLSFSVNGSGEKTVFDLESEKIALSHRALKDSVIEKLGKVIVESGGKILENYG